MCYMLANDISCSPIEEDEEEEEGHVDDGDLLSDSSDSGE